MDTKYRISIHFQLTDSGDWEDNQVATQTLITMAADDLDNGEKPVQYKTGGFFIITLIREAPSRVEALSVAKKLENRMLELWKKGKEAKNAQAKPIGIDCFENL